MIKLGSLGPSREKAGMPVMVITNILRSIRAPEPLSFITMPDYENDLSVKSQSV